MHQIFGLSLGEWSAIAGVMSALLSGVAWVFSKIMSKINSSLQAMDERNYQQAKKNNEISERMSASVDRLNDTLVKQHEESITRFASHDVRLENHEIRISELEKERD